MAYSNASGLGVYNQYGVRNTGGAVGKMDHDGVETAVAFSFTGQSLNDGFVPPVVIPKGARFTRAFLRVDEAFDLGGTSPTLRVGAAGSVATNGFVVTEAELENVGTKAPASAGAGTWSTTSTTGTTAAAKFAFDLGGTTPTVSSSVGKATLVLYYIDVAKA